MRLRIVSCGLAVLLSARAAPAFLPAGPSGAWWRTDVSAAPVDAQSAEIIAWLAGQGGFGTGEMRVDFSIELMDADATTPLFDVTKNPDWFQPDCDEGVPIPLPPGGAIEGETGYQCTGGGDCHLLVWDPTTDLLHELFVANLAGDTLTATCDAVWDLSRVYGPFGRGRDCSSADAAGFPIAPLLFDADEVAAGSIDHAIRFILPNSRIRYRTYVLPATHSTLAASGGASAIPYGARLRLRADYPLETLPSEGARVVARALQKYGMLLADGGNIALNARSDRFTTAKWSGLLDTYDLSGVAITDFVMIDGGTRYQWTGDCVRAPEPDAAALAGAAIMALLGAAGARGRRA